MNTGDRILTLAHKKLEAGDAAGFYHCLDMHRAWVAKTSGQPDKLMRGETHDRPPRLNPQENKHV